MNLPFKTVKEVVDLYKKHGVKPVFGVWERDGNYCPLAISLIDKGKNPNWNTLFESEIAELFNCEFEELDDFMRGYDGLDSSVRGITPEYRFGKMVRKKLYEEKS